jgi:hypothetical protein
MNSYPAWIQRIPEMIETLARLDREWIDRELAERIIDLRKTAAIGNGMAKPCAGQIGLFVPECSHRIKGHPRSSPVEPCAPAPLIKPRYVKSASRCSDKVCHR